MNLWRPWYSCVQEFQAACSRSRTFVYLVLVLVGVMGGQVAAVPLLAWIHEGVVWFPGDRRSMLDKLATMFLQKVSSHFPLALLIADAYYASRKVMKPLLQEGHQILTRVRSNAVAYQPGKPPKEKRKGVWKK